MAAGILYLVLTLLWLYASYWVAKDAGRRGSRHSLAWGLGTFFGSLPTLIMYLFVREDIQGRERRPGAYE